MTVTILVSGGQTGVDRGAIRAARELGLEIRGWCPPGRESENGPIPEELPLRETPEERSPSAPDVPRSLRTEWNVRDADATLVLSPTAGSAGDAGGDFDPGTAWAIRCAERYGKPVLRVDPWDEETGEVIGRWLAGHEPRALNVAGPSEGVRPRIEERTFHLLETVLRGRPVNRS